MTPAEGIEWLASQCGRGKSSSSSSTPGDGKMRASDHGEVDTAAEEEEEEEVRSDVESDFEASGLRMLQTKVMTLRRGVEDLGWLSDLQKEVDTAIAEEESTSIVIEPLFQMVNQMDALVTEAHHALASAGMPDTCGSIAEGICWLHSQRAQKGPRNGKRRAEQVALDEEEEVGEVGAGAASASGSPCPSGRRSTRESKRPCTFQPGGDPRWPDGSG